jgi:ribonuclease HI
MIDTKYLKIFTDGGSRGNPGEAAVGIVIYDETGTIHEKIGKKIGLQTNNFAEYTALLIAFQTVEDQYKDKTCEMKIDFVLDSELVVKQLKGEYKVKDTTLSQLYQQTKRHEKNFKEIAYYHVKRELNKMADKLVNEALDNKR